MAVATKPPTSAPAKRAILYDRVSTVIQSAAGYSGGADGFQVDKCRHHADRRGYSIVGEITDVESGAEWSTDGIMLALERARAREYDVLVVSDTSRFARNLAKKTVYEADLRRHGVSVEYLNLPDVDGPEGRFMSNVFGALDELERERIAYRTKNGKRQKAHLGKVVGTGRAPYGYAYLTEWVETKHRDIPVGLVPDPTSSAIVARIFAEVPYYSTIEIARRLTTDRVPTPTGRGTRWQASTVLAIVRHPVYRGMWQFAGIEVPVTPLVNDRTWEDAQRLTAERAVARRGGRTAEDDPYELRGLLTCGHCGGALSTDRNPLVTGGRGDVRPTHRVYRCLRHSPRHAREAGREPCPLGTFKAADDSLPDIRWREGDGIEQIAWRDVLAELLDADRFEQQLRRLLDRHADAYAERDRRLADLDNEIAEHERRMKWAGDEKEKIGDRDDPRYKMYDEREGQASTWVKKLRVEREKLAAEPGPGLDAGQAERLRETTAALRAGAENATAVDRRWLYQTLRLRGRVYADRERGQRVGYRAWLRIEWDAVMPIRGAGTHTDSEQDILVICIPRKSR